MVLTFETHPNTHTGILVYCALQMLGFFSFLFYKLKARSSNSKITARFVVVAWNRTAVSQVCQYTCQFTHSPTKYLFEPTACRALG